MKRKFLLMTALAVATLIGSYQEASAFTIKLYHRHLGGAGPNGSNIVDTKTEQGTLNLPLVGNCDYTHTSITCTGDGNSSCPSQLYTPAPGSNNNDPVNYPRAQALVNVAINNINSGQFNGTLQDGNYRVDWNGAGIYDVNIEVSADF